MRCRWLALFFLIGALPMVAQLRIDTSKATIHVEVLDDKGNPARRGLSVQLLQNMNGSGMASNLTNSSGTTDFEGLGPGTYRVRVSGAGIDPAESGAVQVTGTSVFETVSVAVHNNTGGPGAPGSVAIMDPNAPEDAVKEYDRGNHELAHKNWNKAADHFSKAIAIYPQYSSAYNNLAACYEKLGEKDKQREALQKAISVNDHCVPAMVNLAYLEVDDHRMPEAAVLLNKAAAADPSYVEALVLLARVEYMQGHYDAAIADANKAHTLPHEHFAMVHYTAAGAYEREGKIPEVITQLQLFLQEDPKSPKADSVRKTIQALQAGR